MFLFLSKLLPLFIYPLGLTSLLMIAALILLWKQPRWAAGAIALGLLVLLTSSNSGVSQGLVRSLEWQNIPNGELPKATAIVVLGGGTKAPTPPRPWVDVGEAGDRILYGALLYKQDKAPWLILSGGRIQWDGKEPPESADMKEIAVEMGVRESAILQDPDSLNTYQNAVNVRQILAENNLTGKVLLVTSALHMPRSLLVFQRQGIEVIPAPTDFLVSQQDIQPSTTIQGTILNLIPDTQSLQQFTQALKEYIGMVVYRLRGWL
ncbi:hypothetical protein M595_4584 [Lyngbya aestuarii BL J]|mgnify:CR=1 FL=1|uniref:DUF218 domain-containing protein n=1 Tax=Lyngbya aestuarii BL J TaxID=1348334 RepID=U7QC94_9CYAN|nr:YdcF family protein [Lyngbya aestuarii]ERT05469.1 hypothetical protein M595_4584 [Lyngbya aestuarii BL J]